MFRFLSIVLSLSFLAFVVFAQTETIPDPAGSPDSVVVNVTTDPDTGEPTTSIMFVLLLLRVRMRLLSYSISLL